jgi:transcriptional regulator with XRE-family HTH domain
MASTKALPTGENEFLRSLVQKVLDSAATQTEAARRLGVSQSYLNEFLGGTRGAGPKLLKGLARLHPKLSARLLGLGEPDEGPGRTAPDPRTDEERAVDDEFVREFDRDVRGALVEAVQYATERGPRFFRHTWWRLLLDDRKAALAAAGNPIAVGERLVAHARAEDDEARQRRAAALEERDDEDDQRPTLPAPGKKAPANRGTRKDTPSAKKGR